MAKAKTKGAKTTPDGWEIRDRLYELTRGMSPLVFTIPTAHSKRKSLLWFDEEKGHNRELRYATNQKSCFVDEQDGHCTMGRIVFRNGSLRVPENEVTLQKFLSLYHPYVKEGVYEEYKPKQIAANQTQWIELELEAMNTAKALDIEDLEAILRTEKGASVTALSSSELKRDGLVFAKRNPQLFLQLASDENTQLRNFGAKAVENKVLHLSQDQRTFTYGDSKRKVMTVPFGEHPYTALSAFFKTDEGMEVYKAIEKRLK